MLESWPAGRPTDRPVLYFIFIILCRRRRRRRRPKCLKRAVGGREAATAMMSPRPTPKGGRTHAKEDELFLIRHYPPLARRPCERVATRVHLGECRA